MQAEWTEESWKDRGLVYMRHDDQSDMRHRYDRVGKMLSKLITSLRVRLSLKT